MNKPHRQKIEVHSAETRCTVCGKNATRMAFEKLGWTILCCAHCGLYRLRFKGSYTTFIKRYYNKGFFTGSPDRAGYVNYEGDRKAEEKNMREYISGIKRYKRSGKLLDVGCATGLFMLTAGRDGFDVSGVDVSDYAVRIAKKRFPGKVRRSSIERVVYQDRSFDVVTMFDVIEHLKNPRKVLERVHRMLKDDGLLVLNTGDTDSLLARIQGKDWHFFIPPQHFFYFSKKNLTEMLNKTGYEVIGMDRKGKWVTLRYVFYLARQIQQDVLGRLGFTLVGKIAPGKIPIYINLFDNITVYARKTSGKKGNPEATAS